MMWKKVLACSCGVSLLLAGVVWAETEKYVVDMVHSHVGFSVKFKLFASVRGKFEQGKGSAMFDKDTGTLQKVSAELDVKSINTSNTKRDNHLKSDDFFAAQKHPKITFVSTAIEKIGSNRYLVTGDFTMRGVTQKINLNGEFLGVLDDQIAFKAEGQINRQDYGVSWSKPLQKAAGTVVSDEVQLELEIAMKPDSAR